VELSTAEEAALLEKLRGGAPAREEAFHALFHHLHRRIFAVCRQLTASQVEAEDAVQEAFLAIHQALGGFRGDCRLSTWAYRIAIHAALRVRSRRRRVEPLEEAGGVAEGAPLPDAVASARQEAARLERALDELSAEHRAVLSLFAVDGLGHEQIAEILGVPTGTVWSRLHAARKRLQAAVAERG
jgi:RNA polymerase sigma-70 factor (ECF subfamily)